ncbi:RHS repeat-associated core domain-containing protein [Treponema sp. OMZ 799]|uniref:RHS repeat-associated core domain-containing protein n=1 Tax=Treponema sp. OMZ 799 TaxID=2563668 RepID=UPI0020A45518|nr:RHS repeat-associated core domain-containing protein [Treponema sp. OMZ 799]
MKNNCVLKQLNYLTSSRTAIAREQKQFIKIAFAVHLSAVISAERYRSGSGALKSAVLYFVFFMIIINKMQQSAKTKLLLNSPTDMPFGNRWSRYKEPSKNKAEAYRVYVEDTFLPCDAGGARIFSKDDEQAQRVYIKYGNGVETRYKYDEKRRWLDTIETKNVQTQDVFQKIKYSFDPVGNVLGYANDATTYETQQTYSYDSLYQLICVEGTSNQYKGKKSFGMTPVSVAKYKQTFSFDNIGNMTNKLSTTNIPGSQGNSYPKAELDYSLQYEYDPAYAHRLIKAGNRYYRYDANGNITAEKDGPFTDEEEFTFTYSYFEEDDVYGTDYGFGLDAPKETEQSNPQDLFAYRRNYTWNERNLLTKSSDRNYTVHYRYGEDGQRALKYTDEGRSETLYFNNFFTIHIPTQDQNNPQGLRVHKHIFVGNSRLVTAMTHTDNQGDNDEQKAKRYYYHSDHLGSAQFVTDWRGKQYEHIEYTPYGELWVEEVAAGLDKLPFRFTGKELDEETGLYYYGARYLDPKYSRWLSGDPALNDYISKDYDGASGGIYNTVNLNVYHYSGNNPIRYSDPDGKDWLDWVQGGLDAIGLIPGVGEFADGINGVISLGRGDYVSAGLSFASMIPIIGDAVGKGGKATKQLVKHSDEIVGLTKQVVKNSDNIATGISKAINRVDDVYDVTKAVTKSDNTIKNIYKSIKDAPKYPKGFQAIRGQTLVNKVNNGKLLDNLRKVEPGNWKKVFKNGYDKAGNKISIHYFESESKKVFDVKVIDGWSTR